MTYKDDLLSCGELIQNKINAHTTNTVEFGEYSQGKDDFYHMGLAIDNLRGDKDLFLKIIPSSQYVVADESFVISVLLCDGLGNGISGAEITLEGSDGSLNMGLENNSLYSGITNELGVCCFAFDGIESDVTYVASYDDLSSSVDVEYCLFVDYGIADNYNDTWLGRNGTSANRLIANRTTHTTISNDNLGSSKGWYCPVSFDDVEIIYDYIHDEDITNEFIIFSDNTTQTPINASNIGLNSDCTVKITKIGNVLTCYKDNVQSYTRQLASGQSVTSNYFLFQINLNGSDINYKNFRIKAL